MKELPTEMLVDINPVLSAQDLKKADRHNKLVKALTIHLIKSNQMPQKLRWSYRIMLVIFLSVFIYAASHATITFIF